MHNIVHLIDNMDFMRGLPDKSFDLAICDPPYGRGEHGGKCRTKYVRQKNGSSILVRGDYVAKSWDQNPPPEEFFQELYRVSKNQIIWGVNNYPYVFGPGRIVWDKVNDGSDQSDCEIAYNSLTSRIDRFIYMWRGMMQGKSIQEGHIQQGNKRLNEKRIHPTQKPVALYKWILQEYAKAGWTILDTNIGSGSIRIACYDLGFSLEGCENDSDHWNDQEDRFRKHIDPVYRYNESIKADLQAGQPNLFQEDQHAEV